MSYQYTPFNLIMSQLQDVERAARDFEIACDRVGTLRRPPIRMVMKSQALASLPLTPSTSSPPQKPKTKTKNSKSSVSSSKPKETTKITSKEYWTPERRTEVAVRMKNWWR